VAHAVKRCDSKEKEDFDAAAALPHAVAPVGAPCVYCCGGERSACCCGGAEESKGGGGDEQKNGNKAAALPQAMAPVVAPSAYSCGGPMRGRDATETRQLRLSTRSAKRGGGEAL
jgi:hypothetical protein